MHRIATAAASSRPGSGQAATAMCHRAFTFPRVCRSSNGMELASGRATIADHPVRFPSFMNAPDPLPAGAAGPTRPGVSTETATLAVAAHRASVVYPSTDAPVHALHEIDLSIAPGEFV